MHTSRDYTTGGDNARQSATCGGAASCGALRQLSIANTRQRAAAATKAMMPPAGGAATSRAARTARAARPRAADDSPGHLASLAARPERRPWRGWRAAGRGRQHHKHLSEEANGSARVVGLCKSKGHGGAKREISYSHGTPLRKQNFRALYVSSELNKNARNHTLFTQELFDTIT